MPKDRLSILYRYKKTTYRDTDDTPLSPSPGRLTVVRKVIETFDVPMWEPTGEKIDLSEGQAKTLEKGETAAAEEEGAEEVWYSQVMVKTLSR